MKCKRGGLVTVRHNNVADEWGALYAAALTPSAVAHEPLINYDGRRMVKGGATESLGYEELDKQEEAYRMEIQVDDKNMTADKEEERGDKGFHIFLMRGIACIFDVRITDLNAARHRGAPTSKVLKRGGN